MSCNCHTKQGISVRVAKPDDQCTMCARKHVKNAWGAWGEFTYEDDFRDYVSDQLRKAADHLKFEHRDVALLCRDVAVAIEENRDAEYRESIAVALDNLRKKTLELFYADHPDAMQRLDEIKEQSNQKETQK